MGEAKWDRIYIRDLTCRCIVGINPDEREKKQDILLNITLFADLRDACRSDDIHDTVDYKGIKQSVIDFVEQSSFFLIERLADEVARIALANERVHAVEVTIDKPGALRFARSVAVSIFREKTGL